MDGDLMYCIHCGKEIVGGESFCMGCGNPIPVVKKVEKGKGIASMILGIIAVLYSLLSLAVLTVLTDDFYQAEISFKLGYAFGYTIIQNTLAIIGICLAVSESRNNKNSFNAVGFWLAILTFIILALNFLYIIGS